MVSGSSLELDVSGGRLVVSGGSPGASDRSASKHLFKEIWHCSNYNIWISKKLKAFIKGKTAGVQVAVQAGPKFVENYLFYFALTAIHKCLNVFSDKIVIPKGTGYIWNVCITILFLDF